MADLLAYAVAGIQRLIFTSNRQAVIRESSRLVRDFDDGVVARPEAVLAGGGRGLLVVARERVPDTERWLRAQLATLSADLSLSVVTVPYERRQERACLRWLWQVAAARKDGLPAPGWELPQTTGDELCVSCHLRDGDVEAERHMAGADGRRLCHRCVTLIRRSKQDRQQLRRTLTDVADGRRICVLAADGNNLGQTFESMPSLEALAGVSDATKLVFTSTLEAAAHEERDRVVRPITGGDDIRAFLGPDGLERFVGNLVRGIHEGIDRARGWLRTLPDGAAIDNRLAQVGLGIGAIVAPEKFPILRLLDAAHNAERRAKEYCRRTGPRSAIQLRIVASGDELLTEQAGSMPCSLVAGRGGRAEWDHLFARAHELAKVPASQRAQLRAQQQRSQSDRTEAMNLFAYQVARTEAWQQYFQQIGVDWRLKGELEANIPTSQDQSLADLLVDRMARRPARPQSSEVRP